MKTDVMILLKHGCDAFAVIGEVCGRDGIVHDFDVEHAVIDATIGAEFVSELHRDPRVAYVRPVLSYHEAA